MSRLPEPIESTEYRLKEVGQFSLYLGAVLVFLAALPLISGLVGGPGVYLQQQTALDDQMVYAAWMKQAAQGQFLFSNLFAIDPQPGLTIHLYFWALGLLSTVLGSAWTLTVARLGFSFLFVWLLGRFLVKLDLNIAQSKLGILLASLGGGLGWAGWELFGRVMLKPSPIAPLTNGRLSIDVWQPEAFVFPSMLTSGLFMASLCLILVIFGAVISAKDSWKPVPWGAAAFFLLMNIHSYDVLLVALALLGFLAVLLGVKKADGAWIARAAVMGAGALPPAAWFIYVLQKDAVFQNRAATLTYSPTLAQVFVGILPLLAAAFVGLWLSAKEESQRPIGAGVLSLLLAAGWAPGIGHNPDGYFVTLPAFVVILGAALAGLFMLKESHPGKALLWAWAVMGIVGLCFPALFQRKLAMGMVIPWGLLAGLYAAEWIRPLEKSRKLVFGGLGCAVACISSILWVQREMMLVKANVSSTTTHAPFLDEGAAKLLATIEKLPKGTIVLAMPGVPIPDQNVPGAFKSPYLPDLNPMVAGLAGKIAFAGHWSETPQYEKRRGAASTFFLTQTNAEQRGAILTESKAAYALAPNPSAFPELPIVQPETLGKVTESSEKWSLVELTR